MKTGDLTVFGVGDGAVEAARLDAFGEVVCCGGVLFEGIRADCDVSSI